MWSWGAMRWEGFRVLVVGGSLGVRGGVPQVVVSAPVKDPDPVLNVVMGCNEVAGGFQIQGSGGF